jgi:lipid II:glycine glycyltransferase (peptidoglycan interpeptide bridge formation enzyme)
VTTSVQGSPAGVLLAVTDGNRGYGWIGGTLRAFGHTGANTAAHSAVFLEAMRRGCTSFDLVGHVDEGVARFKRSLGAEPQPYVDAVSSWLPEPVVELPAQLRDRMRGSRSEARDAPPQAAGGR